jgi:hypothetical protein
MVKKKEKETKKINDRPLKSDRNPGQLCFRSMKVVDNHFARQVQQRRHGWAAISYLLFASFFIASMFVHWTCNS